MPSGLLSKDGMQNHCILELTPFSVATNNMSLSLFYANVLLSDSSQGSYLKRKEKTLSAITGL